MIRVKPDPQTISLGGHDWIVRPLTLGQVQRIEEVLSKTTGKIALGLRVVAIGLSRDHPAQSAGLATLAADIGALSAAVDTVLYLGGFTQRVEVAADDGKKQSSWRDVRGRLITALSILPAAADEIEWHDVLDLFDYWSEWPPQHEILRAVHFKNAPQSSSSAPAYKPMTAQEAELLRTLHPGGLVQSIS